MTTCFLFRWIACAWPLIGAHTLVPAESTTKTNHVNKLSRLNPTALVLAVNASRQPHD